MPLKLIAFGMAVGPWVAIFSGYLYGESILGIDVNDGLLLHYSAYVLLNFILIYHIKSDVIINFRKIDGKCCAIYTNRLLFAAVISFIFIFVFSGFDIVFGNLDRGEVRVQLGYIGPIFTFVVKFLLPSIVFGVVIISCFGSQRNFQVKHFLIYIIVFLASFITGYKSIAIIVFIPALCFWLGNASVKRALIIVVFSILTATVSKNLLSSQDGGTLFDSLLYMYARTTIVAAYGVVGAWDYTNIQTVDVIPIILFTIFGSHLSSLGLNAVDYHTTQSVGDYAKLVTIQYYPNTDGAEEGTVNLTITLFGELVGYSHTYWPIGFAVFITIVFFTIKLMRRYFISGRLVNGIFLFLLVLMVFLPIVNSSGLFSIVSLPVIIYAIATYYSLRILIPNGK
jgi:hypothetical protein